MNMPPAKIPNRNKKPLPPYLKRVPVDPSILELAKGYGDVLSMGDGIPDERKMSTRLIEILLPWLDEDIPAEALVDCAALAWNACVNGEDHFGSTDHLSNTLVDYANNKRMLDLIAQMKKQKQKLYPRDLRTILRVQMFDDGQEAFRVNVIAELKPEHVGKALEGILGKKNNTRKEKKGWLPK